MDFRWLSSYCINFNSPPGGSVATIIQSLRGLDVRYEYLGAQPAPIIPTPAGFFIPRRPYDECQCCLVEYNRRPFFFFFRCLYACEPSSRSLREDPPSNRQNTRSTPHTASKAPKGREGIRTWNKAKSRRGIANGRSQGARIARTLQAGLSRSAAQRWHQDRALARSAYLC